jgi:protein required for attachment to host cells
LSRAGNVIDHPSLIEFQARENAIIVDRQRRHIHQLERRNDELQGERDRLAREVADLKLRLVLDGRWPQEVTRGA